VAAENVTVRFFDGKKVLGSETLDKVPAGSNLTAVFSWTPTYGKHSLKFMVDPDNMINETIKTDNQVKDDFVFIKPASFIPGFGLALLVAAMAGAAALLVRRRRR
jgi:hypothetical protein